MTPRSRSIGLVVAGILTSAVARGGSLDQSASCPDGVRPTPTQVSSWGRPKTTYR